MIKIAVNMNNFSASSLANLDRADRDILRIVQKDNQLTHAAIGEEIGLSMSAVRRRLVALRDGGLISKDVSIINADSVGVTLIVQVSFGEDTCEGYQEFDAHIAKLPNVKQSYHVSGATDYVLIVQGPSLQWYEAWAKDSLMSIPAIQRHDTSVVWSCKKFETAILIED